MRDIVQALCFAVWVVSVVALLALCGAKLRAQPPDEKPLPRFDPHWRRASAEGVVDGDTLDLDVVHEWGGVRYVNVGVRVRLASVDAPEMDAMRETEQGRVPDEVVRGRARAARQVVISWVRTCEELSAGSDYPLVVWSRAQGSFGRPLARVLCRETGSDLEKTLVDMEMGEHDAAS